MPSSSSSKGAVALIIYHLHMIHGSMDVMVIGDGLIFDFDGVSRRPGPGGEARVYRMM